MCVAALLHFLRRGGWGLESTGPVSARAAQEGAVRAPGRGGFSAQEVGGRLLTQQLESPRQPESCWA